MKFWEIDMSEIELTKLRIRFNELSSQLDSLRSDPENNGDVITSLNKEKTVVYEQMTRLTRKLWEEQHEHVDISGEY